MMFKKLSGLSEHCVANSFCKGLLRNIRFCNSPLFLFSENYHSPFE